MNTSQTPHPAESVLQAFALGKLDDAALEAVNEHLETCEECRQKVGGVSADTFLGRVRAAQGTLHSTFGQSMLNAAQQQKATKPAPTVDTLPPGLAEHPDYAILKELGRGGMGVVYLAHNKLMGRDEVLKVMSRQIMERPGVLDRFLREIRAVAKLRHPNIVTAYSAFRLDANLVFAMEYVDGLDLSKLVKAKGRLPVAHACHFIHQAALGLQNAHENGLIHRDIKPHNLMLSRTGDRAVVKILDFGLAKATREEKVDTALTSAGQALGTPDFIAPEQILDAQSADIRADIYSLGGTLFYLLTGRPPFKANSLYDLYQAHISRNIDPLNMIRPEVPSELAALVGKMMAKEPKRRFQTPGEVAQALTPFFKKDGAPFKSPSVSVSRFGATKAADPNPMPVSSPSEPPTITSEPIVSTRKPATKTPTAVETPQVTAGSTRNPPAHSRTKVIAASVFGMVAFLGVILITIELNYKDKDKEAKIKAEIGLPDKGVEAKAVVAPPVQGKAVEQPSLDDPDEDFDSTMVMEGDDEGFSEMAEEGPVVRPKAMAAGFTPLFNGKNLDGWKTHPSQKGRWRVENGILIGSGPALSHLYTERGDFRNFHLRVEARYNGGGSGAVVFRSGFGPEMPKDAPKFPRGLHATINSTHGCRGNTGGLWAGGTVADEFVTGPKRPPVSPGEWFTLEILTSDNNVEVLVNTRLSSFKANGNHYPGGHLALQQLTPETVLEFRSIEIREFDLKKVGPNEVVRLDGNLSRVSSVAFSPDSRQVITGALGLVEWVAPNGPHFAPSDSTVRLWEVSSGRNLQTFPGHPPHVRGTVFSRDGRFAASCGGFPGPAQHFNVYEVAAGRKLHELKRSKAAGKVQARIVTFSPDGRRLLAAFPNGTIETWMLVTEKELPPLRLKAGKPRPDEFPTLLFTSDRSYLITGSQRGAVEIWSLKTGERLKLLAGHSGAVIKLACSADDSRILSGGVDRTARLWDVASGKQLQLLDCSEDGLASLALSPNGKLALTGGRYGTIHLWDLADGHEITRLEGHTMWVGCLAFSSDGRLAVSGSDDKTARVWRLPAVK